MSQGGRIPYTLVAGQAGLSGSSRLLAWMFHRIINGHRDAKAFQEIVNSSRLLFIGHLLILHASPKGHATFGCMSSNTKLHTDLYVQTDS